MYKIKIFLSLESGTVTRDVELPFPPFKKLVLTFAGLEEDDDHEVFEIRSIHYNFYDNSIDAFLEDLDFIDSKSDKAYKEYLLSIGFEE